MTDLDLPGHVGHDDVTIESRAISGGALQVLASVRFSADVTIPRHARQFGEAIEEQKRTLRDVVRARFYGDVQRNAVAAFAGLANILDEVEGITDAMREQIGALFKPLLQAGKEIITP